MSTRVQMSDIHLSYPTESGTVAVLDNASLTVPPGESLAITGPSGSGKTSLLLLLSGLERPDQGEILVGSERLGDMDSNALADWRSKHLGIIFQSFHLLPGLSALGNVSLPLEIAGQSQARERARAMLDAVGLSHRLGHYPAQLSGGEHNGWRLPAPWCTNPTCCWAMNPPAPRPTNRQKVLSLLFDLQRERQIPP